MKRKVFRIGTARYNWPMSAHASQAFNIAHCTDSEDLPMKILEDLSKDSQVMTIWTQSAVYIINCRPEERFFFIYDRCMLQDQDDDITKSILYFDPKFVSVIFNITFRDILCSCGNL